MGIIKPVYLYKYWKCKKLDHLTTTVLLYAHVWQHPNYRFYRSPAYTIILHRTILGWVKCGSTIRSTCTSSLFLPRQYLFCFLTDFSKFMILITIGMSGIYSYNPPVQFAHKLLGIVHYSKYLLIRDWSSLFHIGLKSISWSS